MPSEAYSTTGRSLPWCSRGWAAAGLAVAVPAPVTPARTRVTTRLNRRITRSSRFVALRTTGQLGDPAASSQRPVGEHPPHSGRRLCGGSAGRAGEPQKSPRAVPRELHHLLERRPVLPVDRRLPDEPE